MNKEIKGLASELKIMEEKLFTAREVLAKTNDVIKSTGMSIQDPTHRQAIADELSAHGDCKEKEHAMLVKSKTDLLQDLKLRLSALEVERQNIIGSKLALDMLAVSQIRA